MFLYLIAFLVAFFTIFGLPCTRNSLRNFSNNGYNQLLERLLPKFRALLSQRNEEFLVEHETSGIEIEERLEKADVFSKGEKEKAQDEKTHMQKKSTDSFHFNYRSSKYDSNHDAESREWSFETNSIKNERTTDMVRKDTGNLLQKTPVSGSEKKNFDSLFEALWQDTIKVDTEVEDDFVKETFKKNRIIDETTFEKMLEDQTKQAAQERIGHHHNE